MSANWMNDVLKPANTLLEQAVRKLREQDEGVAVLEDQMAAYLDEVIELLMAEFEFESDEAAWDFVFDVILDLEDSEQLPVFPEEGASAEDISAWMNAARTVGLADEVIAAAEEGWDEEETAE